MCGFLLDSREGEARWTSSSVPWLDVKDFSDVPQKGEVKVAAEIG